LFIFVLSVYFRAEIQQNFRDFRVSVFDGEKKRRDIFRVFIAQIRPFAAR
jgi:hypothetical protein